MDSFNAKTGLIFISHLLSFSKKAKFFFVSKWQKLIAKVEPVVSKNVSFNDLKGLKQN